MVHKTFWQTGDTTMIENYTLTELVRNNCNCACDRNCDECQIHRQAILAAIEYMKQEQQHIEKQLQNRLHKR